jgi:ribosome maturation factor RimP
MAQSRNFELVDVEFLKEAGSWHLRVYLDKEGGITIDDLAEVNRELSDVMDREDFIEESYILEVSSPGLLRPFKKPKDFLRNIGQEVEMKLFQPFTWEENGKKFSSKELEGKLVSYEDNKVTLEFDENETLSFEVKDIALIRKAIDF